MTKYTVKLISARDKPRVTEFEYMIGKSEKTFQSDHNYTSFVHIQPKTTRIFVK